MNQDEQRPDNAPKRGRRSTGRSGPKVVDWAPAFISALCETGQASRAAEAAGIVYGTAWRRRKDDPVFEEAYQDALKISAALLEAEAVRRAKDGLRRMKFNAKTGKAYIDPETGQPYIEHEYSDTLMLSLLKRYYPDLYKEKTAVELSGGTHNTVNVVTKEEREIVLRQKQEAIASRKAISANGNGSGHN